MYKELRDGSCEPHTHIYSGVQSRLVLDGSDTLVIPEDKHHRWRNGSDILYKPFMQEIQGRIDNGTDFTKITCDMCASNNMSWNIFDQQRDFVRPPGKLIHATHWTFQKACWWQHWHDRCPAVYPPITKCRLDYKGNIVVCYWRELWETLIKPPLHHCHGNNLKPPPGPPLPAVPPPPQLD